MYQPPVVIAKSTLVAIILPRPSTGDGRAQKLTLTVIADDTTPLRLVKESYDDEDQRL